MLTFWDGIRCQWCHSWRFPIIQTLCILISHIRGHLCYIVLVNIGPPWSILFTSPMLWKHGFSSFCFKTSRDNIKNLQLCRNHLCCLNFSCTLFFSFYPHVLYVFIIFALTWPKSKTIDLAKLMPYNFSSSFMSVMMINFCQRCSDPVNCVHLNR